MTKIITYFSFLDDTWAMCESHNRGHNQTNRPSQYINRNIYRYPTYKYMHPQSTSYTIHYIDSIQYHINVQMRCMENGRAHGTLSRPFNLGLLNFHEFLLWKGFRFCVPIRLLSLHLCLRPHIQPLLSPSSHPLLLLLFASIHAYCMAGPIHMQSRSRICVIWCLCSGHKRTKRTTQRNSTKCSNCQP